MPPLLILPSRVFSAALLLVLCATLAGCGSGQNVRVNIDATKNRTTYETRSMRLSKVTGFSGINQPRFESIVQAECAGVDCVPETFDYVLRSDPGGGRIRLQATDMVLMAGDEAFTWDDPFRQPEGTLFDARGTLVKVPCTLEQLKVLASGATVHGSVGGITFRIFSINMDPLRSLIARVERSSSSTS